MVEGRNGAVMFNCPRAARREREKCFVWLSPQQALVALPPVAILLLASTVHQLYPK